MKVLTFLSSRRFRYPLALALVVFGVFTLVATKAETLVPFAMALVAAFIAWDG